MTFKTNKLINRLFFVVISLLLATSCTTLKPTKVPEAEKLYNSALDKYIVHKWGEAVKLFNQAEKKRLEEKKLQNLYFYRGKSYYNQNNYSNAVSDFTRYLSVSPKGDFADEIKCSLINMSPLKYSNYFSTINFDLVPLELKKKCLLLYGSYLWKTGDLTNSIIYFNKSRKITEDPKIKKELEFLIEETFFSIPETMETDLKNRNDYFFDLSILKEIKNGKWNNLDKFIINKTVPEHIINKYKYYSYYYNKLTEEAKTRFYVFLPFSGPFSSIGVRILSDFLYGISISAPIILGDTRGNNILSSIYWDEIEKNINPVVFGPVLRWELNEVIPQNFIYRIPSVTINSSSEIVARDKFTIRDNIVPKTFVKELVKYMFSKGIKKFAIFQPDNDYGNTYANYFSQEVESNGGKVLWKITYKENEKNFRFYFWKLLNIKDRDEERDFFNSLKTEELKLPINAVFIADLPSESNFLIPQFAYFGMKKLIFLGTRDWLKSQQLAEDIGNYEVYIPGIFNPASDDPEIENFVDNYEMVFNKTPTSIDYFTFEVSKIFNVCYNQTGSRKDTINCFKREKGFDVPTGYIKFNDNGEVIRPINIYTIKKWQWIKIKKK